MEFINLRNAVNAHYNHEAEKFRNNLNRLTCGAALESWYYSDRMTAAAHAAVTAADPGAPLPETAKKKMLARFDRENEKDRARYLDKLARAEAAPDIRTAVIDVEWHNSTTWGKCPAAEIRAERAVTSARASGCGYDKESAAIASAANANSEIMRILYKHAEQGGTFPYSVHTWAGLPSFDGGCGVSCFYNVFEACGYKWLDVAHGKNYDVYRLEVIA